MTRKQFNDLVRRATTDGICKHVEMVTPPFSASEVQNEFWQIDGYEILFQADKFIWMKDVKTQQYINQSELTDDNFESMSDCDILQMIDKLQGELKARQTREANEAIKQFEEAFENLKRFGNVRVRISATGDVKHQHTTMERLNIQILPLN